ERAIAPLERIAPELVPAGDELREAGVRLREVAVELRSFLASLEAEPGGLRNVESELERIATARRRFAAGSYEELLQRAAEALAEPDARDSGAPPAAAARGAARA